MNLKIVNQYIAEVLYLETRKRNFSNVYAQAIKDEYKKVRPVSSSSNTNSDEQRNPDQGDSKSEEEKNLALLQKLGADINPRLQTNQTR